MRLHGLQLKWRMKLIINCFSLSLRGLKCRFYGDCLITIARSSSTLLIVASLDKVLYDNSVFLVALNKQQIN